MRLHIDWTACDGRGLCVELLPEILTTDDWGYPLARPVATGVAGAGPSDPAVPAGIRRHLERAVAQCPRQALRRLDA
jgi:ferredoxin